MPVQVQAFQGRQPNDRNKKIVTTGEDFEQMLRYLSGSPILCLDYETSGTAWYQHAKACGLALATFDAEWRIWNWYIPFRHHTGEEQLDIDKIAPAFKQLLENPNTLKIGHNIKFEDHFSRNEGWRIQGPRYDTMVGARLYDENRLIGLKDRAKSDLFHEVDGEKRLKEIVHQRAKANKMGIRKYMAKYGYSQVPIYECGTYACWDTQFTLELWQKYEWEHSLSSRYARIWNTEMRLTEYLCDMERNGLLVDVDYLETLKDSLGGVKASLEDKIESHLGGGMFNLGSDAQLRRYLTEVLRLPLTKKTRSFQYSVDREVLEEFQNASPVLPLLLEWRDADKIETTYTDSILDRLDSNNFLHGEFQQVGTNTGRLSSKNPNLQNFSSDNDDRALVYSGKKLKDGGIDPWSVRRGIINRGKGWVRLFFDYSQIELRVLAHYSKDPVLVDSYLKGEDVHTRTSLEVFGTDDPAMRRRAKIINFGLSYCLSEIGFARQANLSLKDATEYMGKFFQKYNGIEQFRYHFWNHIRMAGGEFQNLFGRPRRVPSVNSTDDYQRGRGERQAIGSLIQGTASELTKESIVRIGDWLRAESIPALLASTVHDEIQIDCPVDCLTQVVQGVKPLMEAFPEFSPIPVTVDGDWTTTNWAEKQSLPI